jgi:hypothetical protein
MAFPGRLESTLILIRENAIMCYRTALFKLGLLCNYFVAGALFEFVR